MKCGVIMLMAQLDQASPFAVHKGRKIKMHEHHYCGYPTSKTPRRKIQTDRRDNTMVPFKCWVLAALSAAQGWTID
ncbi:uncharacterized protein BDR25DRAFT_356615 [Lindgomyces ingoldianus]|uniref:Uncharacterized protein n=1 Tax=Lindgomyces ingoldianus TaxID=673940 RepID=A0ACB6QQW7_9PLEO|nr:uncharacterized protein BDR25DRAFT_356615 [Lindgomyces ingoldianus]KAF2469389.1 hypothetical protein BDR25DRAFT_356615 [Lindgomyces ingoldianus]